MHNCLWWRCLQQTSNPQKIRPRYCLDLPLHLHLDLPFCIGLDLNRSGHSFRACVALRLTQLCLLPRFRAPRPRERGWFPPVEARFMCGRSVLRTSTCCSSVSAAPFMLTNSLCACSEDREISTAFCRSSFGTRNSRSFSAGYFQWRLLFCLRPCYLLQQIGQKEKLFVATLGILWMFERYLKNTIRVWPSNSVCNFVFTGRILPSLHLLAFRSGCIAPRCRVQLLTTTWRS